MFMRMFYRKPYKSLEEYYKVLDVLTVELRANGNVDAADKIDSLLHHQACTTASELLGDLYRALSGIKVDLPKQLRKQVSDCRYFARHHRIILGLD